MYCKKKCPHLKISLTGFPYCMKYDNAVLRHDGVRSGVTFI